MSERFEFTDGSYYEFERWSAEELKGYHDLNTDTWIVNLTSEKPSDNKDIECVVEGLIHPNDAKAFSDRFTEAVDEEREYKPTKYKTRRRNKEVMGVGLTRCNRVDFDGPNEFERGIYLPIKFCYSVANELFIDISTITSKVIYEPSLLTSYAKKILATKNR